LPHAGRKVSTKQHNGSIACFKCKRGRGSGACDLLLEIYILEANFAWCRKSTICPMQEGRCPQSSTMVALHALSAREAEKVRHVIFKLEIY
jgi:hypothetical protein